jgi:hypothetical protein
LVCPQTEVKNSGLLSELGNTPWEAESRRRGRDLKARDRRSKNYDRRKMSKGRPPAISC